MKEARNVEALTKALEGLKRKSRSTYILFTSYCIKVQSNAAIHFALFQHQAIIFIVFSLVIFIPILFYLCILRLSMHFANR